MLISTTRTWGGSICRARCHSRALAHMVSGSKELIAVATSRKAARAGAASLCQLSMRSCTEGCQRSIVRPHYSIKLFGARLKSR